MIDIAGVSLLIGAGIVFAVWKAGYTDYSALLFFTLAMGGKLITINDYNTFLFWNVIVWISVAFLVVQLPNFLKRVSNGKIGFKS